MALWIIYTLVGFGLVLAGLGWIIIYGSSRWNNKTSQIVATLVHAALQSDIKKVSFKDVDKLPAPVGRYLRQVLKEGQPMIRSARVTQVGEFNIGKANDAWRPFKATQYFVSQPSGFVWDASIQMAPLVAVRVRDAYIKGHGSMQAKILSLLSMVDEQAKAELNAAALQRYLAEAMWFPTVFLPDEGVVWSAIDDSRALATLTDSGTTVSLEFHFNNAGELIKVFTPTRYREVNGKYELTPWAGYVRHCEERNGVRIPDVIDVEWQLPEGSSPYWKGRIIDIDYNLSL